MKARHEDPKLDALYELRRLAADASGLPDHRGSDGWARLERVEDQLRECDPSGAWTLEGRTAETGWEWGACPVEQVEGDFFVYSDGERVLVDRRADA